MGLRNDLFCSITLKSQQKTPACINGSQKRMAQMVKMAILVNRNKTQQNKKRGNHSITTCIAVTFTMLFVDSQTYWLRRRGVCAPVDVLQMENRLQDIGLQVPTSSARSCNRLRKPSTSDNALSTFVAFSFSSVASCEIER